MEQPSWTHEESDRDPMLPEHFQIAVDATQIAASHVSERPTSARDRLPFTRPTLPHDPLRSADGIRSSFQSP